LEELKRKTKKMIVIPMEELRATLAETPDLFTGENDRQLVERQIENS
jgi:hypothetical protein